MLVLHSAELSFSYLDVSTEFNEFYKAGIFCLKRYKRLYAFKEYN